MAGDEGTRFIERSVNHGAVSAKPLTKVADCLDGRTERHRFCRREPSCNSAGITSGSYLVELAIKWQMSTITDHGWKAGFLALARVQVLLTREANAGDTLRDFI